MSLSGLSFKKGTTKYSKTMQFVCGILFSVTFSEYIKKGNVQTCSSMYLIFLVVIRSR